MASFMRELRQGVKSPCDRRPAITGEKALLDRLRRGQVWLVSAWARIQEGPVDPGEEERLLEAIGLWDELEQVLRNLYDFEGCPMLGGKCNPEAPVVCLTCASRCRSEDGLAQQGRLVE